ncbi:MAG: hypothetical protein E7056_08985 [Lentisphaerae bacterium]|nr:hypothetical protein [Lentisphaerota bacterium]
MLFDISCLTGSWAFRKLAIQTLPDLKKHLESLGISGAAVSHNHAVFYQNCHDGNLELAEELAQCKLQDYFAPVAILNPTYAVWERDLEFCVKTLGFKALKLVPKYHDYELSSNACSEIMAAAAELDIPVMIPMEMVNFRQRHHMEPLTPLSLDAIAEQAKKVPQAKVIVIGAPVADMEYPENLYFEISRSRSCYSPTMPLLKERIGAERILFGSGAPMREVEPALLKFNHADFTSEERELVAWKNAARLLKL